MRWRRSARLPRVACAVALALGCGGKTDEAGGGGGTAGAGGKGGAGAGGSGGQGGSGGIAQCKALESQYAEALGLAAACKAGLPGQCTQNVDDKLACGCPTSVNPANVDDVASLAAIRARWDTLPCTGLVPCSQIVECSVVVNATCVLDAGGNGRDACKGAAF